MKRKKGPKKLTAAQVQTAFNAAIRRRDGECVMTHSPHNGHLEASHFFPVGGNGALRFYPPNCHTQCSAHHLAEWHNGNALPYTRWMDRNVPETGWMESHRKVTIRYTQALLEDIHRLCNEDRLDVVEVIIRGQIEEAWK